MSATQRVVLPAVFVILWSSGYAACKAAVLHAGSFTVLFLRFGGAIVVLGGLAWLGHARWPQRRADWAHLVVAGLLIHAVYLGINFHAAADGFPVGITALIGALQPLATALAVGLALGERVSPRQWGGLVLGLVGVLMVLSDRIAFDWSRPLQAGAIALAMLSLTAGTLYQKRFCAFMDWRSGLIVQLALPALLMLGAAVRVESFAIDWAPEFAASILWLAGLSSLVYGIMHLIFLRGAAASVAGLLYLVPVITSTFMYVLFDERLGPLALAGMLVTVIGVAYASTGGRVVLAQPVVAGSR